MVGAQRRAGRGDVDDDVGQTRRRRALGGAQALDDAVNLDAVLLREELLGEPPVFGGDPQPPAMALAEIGGDVVEIGHGVDVEPDVGNGNHDIGAAEAEPCGDLGARLPVGQRLAQQILAGDAEVDAAGAKFAGDFGGRQEADLDVGAAGNAGAVLALVAGQLDRQPGAAEQLERLVAQPALRWQRQRQRHAPPPRNCSMRSSQTEKPTPGMAVLAPSNVSRRS